jgi:hypothetical protein
MEIPKGCGTICALCPNRAPTRLRVRMQVERPSTAPLLSREVPCSLGHVLVAFTLTPLPCGPGISCVIRG